MNKVDLDELDRLHVLRYRPIQSRQPNQSDVWNWDVAMEEAFPAISAELRRLRRVEGLQARLIEAYDLQYRNGVREGWIKKGFCQGIIFKSLLAEIASINGGEVK